MFSKQKNTATNAERQSVNNTTPQRSFDAVDPAAVNATAIKDAAARIRPYVPISSVKESFYLQNRTGHRTLLKLENLNRSGSFKIRGALNAILQLSHEEKNVGIVAASAGNHAQGVAYACKELGAPATIFMPTQTPLVKVAATRELGAEVQLVGDSYDDAFDGAVAYQATTGTTFIHPFANAQIINGQGTCGLELIEQVPDLGLVVVPIGGGGLASGVACVIKSLKPDVLIIGVQTEAYPSMALSKKNGQPTEAPVAGRTTIADGIAVKRPSAATWQFIDRYVDDIVLVSESEIASAVMYLMEWDHMLAEGAGAAAIAGLLKLGDKYNTRLGDRSAVCIVSGGNIDVTLLSRIIPHGLKCTGRIIRLAVRLSDKPGRLAELLNVVSGTGANLLEVQHNRLYGLEGYDEVGVQLDLETIDQLHQKSILTALQERHFRCKVLEG